MSMDVVCGFEINKLNILFISIYDKVANKLFYKKVFLFI